MYLSATVTWEAPPPSPTRTFTVPAVPGGATAVMVSLLLSPIVNDDASRPPNVTDDAVANIHPVIVTVVPPLAGPESGDTFDTVGAGTP